jgi:hypothetical protein
MFGNKNTSEDTSFQKQYCKGFNVGTSLVKNLPSDRWELTKEILHAMILEQPKNVIFHSILTGLTYEIVNERTKERLSEIDKINAQAKDLDRGR